MEKTLEMKKETKRLLESGMTHEEIAIEIGVRRPWVSKIAKRLGMDNNKVHNNRKKYEWDGNTAYRARELYVEGKDICEIMQEVKLPQRYIEYILSGWVYPDYFPEGYEPVVGRYSWDLVLAVRNYEGGGTREEIADLFGVSKSMVNVVRNANWNVPKPTQENQL